MATPDFPRLIATMEIWGTVSLPLIVVVILWIYRSYRYTTTQFVEKRIRKWKYLTRGADMITDEYKSVSENPPAVFVTQLIRLYQAAGKAFTVAGPDLDYILVSSTQHIKELQKANKDVLSLLAATKTVRISKRLQNSNGV